MLIRPTAVALEKVIAVGATQRLLLLVEVVSLDELRLPLRLADIVVIAEQLLTLGQDKVLLLHRLGVKLLLEAQDVDIVSFFGLVFVLGLDESLARAVAELRVVLFGLVRHDDARAEGAGFLELFVLDLLVFGDILLQPYLLPICLILHSFQCLLVCFSQHPLILAV